jgi:hypothetical protein
MESILSTRINAASSSIDAPCYQVSFLSGCMIPKRFAVSSTILTCFPLSKLQSDQTVFAVHQKLIVDLAIHSQILVQFIQKLFTKDKQIIATSILNCPDRIHFVRVVLLLADAGA